MDSGFRLIPGFRDCQDPGNNTGHGAVDLGPTPPHVQIVRLAQMIHQSWGGARHKIDSGLLASLSSPPFFLPSFFLPPFLPSSLPPLSFDLFRSRGRQTSNREKLPNCYGGCAEPHGVLNKDIFKCQDISDVFCSCSPWNSCSPPYLEP